MWLGGAGMRPFSAPPGLQEARETSTAASQPPHVSLLDPAELTTRHLAAWRNFQHLSPALESPYLTPEFLRIAARVRPGVQVAVAEEGRGIAGFFPFERRRGDIGRPVGGPFSDVQAVLAAPWWDWDPRQFVRAAGLSVYDFTFQRMEQRPFCPFARAKKVSHTIDLSRGFDAYVAECREQARGRAALSSGLPHQTLARARKLARQFGPLRFTMHEPDPAVLRLVLRWKSAQYRRTGLFDAFALRWTTELLERIHATQTETFAGVLSTLSVGDRVVAGHMGMRSASVLHWWFPSYDVACAKFSPGHVLLMEACRHAATHGIRTIELGEANEYYKLLVTNAGVEVGAGFVGLPSLPDQLRRMRHGTVTLAERLPIGPFRQWPGKLFRRIDRINRFR